MSPIFLNVFTPQSSMPSIWNFSTIEQRKIKLGFSSINWDVMLDAIDGPAINGTPASA
jgi:hypothetical protein